MPKRHVRDAKIASLVLDGVHRTRPSSAAEGFCPEGGRTTICIVSNCMLEKFSRAILGHGGGPACDGSPRGECAYGPRLNYRIASLFKPFFET
jgi:hypothetical protein